MNMVLMGYRGCGKSTVGRLLAERLGRVFVDVDEEVSRRFDLPNIAGVWREYGEDLFRQMEAIAVVELLGEDNRIIALGGGSVMHAEARQALAQADHVWRVYLKCTAEELFRRVQADTHRAVTRANPKKLSGGLKEIQSMLAEREPVYLELADFVCDVTNLTAPQTAERLLAQALPFNP
ncbi:MAG: AAA family ATPase [Phycisphaeraceae bacterium]|nr:AAA family ATPase [Phycisphaeraceae bacterium]